MWLLEINKNNLYNVQFFSMILFIMLIDCIWSINLADRDRDIYNIFINDILFTYIYL